MSETVHYRGKIEIASKGKDLCLHYAMQELLNIGATPKEYYSNEIEQLCDEFYEDYFYHYKTETLYKILGKFEQDLDEEIISANTTDDPDIIEYELRYYNGGAGFSECLEEALDKLENNK